MEAQQNGILSFHETFLISGMAAIMAKTAAAPIERIKLLMQNQSEMIKQGSITHPYSGIIDCAKLTLKNEGLHSFWRGKFVCLSTSFWGMLEIHILSILIN